MKYILRPQHRRPRQTGPSVSLFPFLTVLICTMGALVPLLLGMVRSSRHQAEAAALKKIADQTAAQQTDLQTQLEDAQWRIEQLKLAREQTGAQLADARLQLGHLEDHSRRLRTQLAQHKEMLAELNHLENADSQRSVESKAELERLRVQIDLVRQQLAESQKDADESRRSFAVVPYEGPNQTHRRPIYIECREDAVVLQPEGIELTEDDFEGPLGPGNPLAAALRAVREYMLAQQEFDPGVGEPYPMLLVRPDGINAYYVARAAMRSWGAEFGYELIGDDWKLAYQSPDPRLAKVVPQVVAKARVSQARLAAAAPRHYTARPKVMYRASARGGFVRDGATGDDEDRGSYSATPTSTTGRAGGTGRSGERGPRTEGTGNARNPYISATDGQRYRGGGMGSEGLGTGDENSAGNSYAAATVGPRYGGAAEGTGGGSGGDASTDGSRFGNAQAAAGSLRNNGNEGGTSGGETSESGQPAGKNGDRWAQNGTPTQEATNVERPEGYVAGQPAHESGAPPTDAEQGRSLRPGEWEPGSEKPQEKSDCHVADGRQGPRSGGLEINQNFSPKKSGNRFDDQGGGKPPLGLASQRGRNWGLRDTARGSVGITRPIRIECFADRLVVIAGRGSVQNKVIQFSSHTESSIDTFISAIWEQMESWGMAGHGMYWRPLLQVRVAPGAEQRFLEFSALLEGSGLVLEKK